jgi:hypothetical protein
MIVSLTGHAIPSDVPSFSASSFAGLTAGGVECNSTIPGEGDSCPRLIQSSFSASPISPPTALVTPLRRCHACPWRSAPGVAMPISTAIR